MKRALWDYLILTWIRSNSFEGLVPSRPQKY